VALSGDGPCSSPGALTARLMRQLPIALNINTRGN
jgi:hypothetical protein